MGAKQTVSEIREVLNNLDVGSSGFALQMCQIMSNVAIAEAIMEYAEMQDKRLAEAHEMDKRMAKAMAKK